MVTSGDRRWRTASTVFLGLFAGVGEAQTVPESRLGAPPFLSKRSPLLLNKFKLGFCPNYKHNTLPKRTDYMPVLLGQIFFFF